MNEQKQHPFERLPQDIAPPPGLEDAIRNQLVGSNLIQSEPKKVWGWLAVAAAALIAGILIGRFLPQIPVETDTRPRFVFFLFEDGNFQAENQALLVDEYRNWAGELFQQGYLEGGEKLKDPRLELGRQLENPAVLSGFFQVRASSMKEAEQLAETCPHLKYGGSVEVRQIDPT